MPVEDAPSAAVDAAADVTSTTDGDDVSQLVPGASTQTVQDVASFATMVADEVTSRVSALIAAATEPVADTAEATLNTLEEADTSPTGKPWFAR